MMNLVVLGAAAMLCGWAQAPSLRLGAEQGMAPLTFIHSDCRELTFRMGLNGDFGHHVMSLSSLVPEVEEAPAANGRHRLVLRCNVGGRCVTSSMMRNRPVQAPTVRPQFETRVAAEAAAAAIRDFQQVCELKS